MIRLSITLILWSFTASTVIAEGVPAPGQVGVFTDRKPLFQNAPSSTPLKRASLFVDQRSGGFFAPLPQRLDRPLVGGSGGSVAARLRDMIARAEAGSAGYDAVQHGARIKTPKPPTRMTIQEIYDWIDATPGQPHAIGRYQFIPTTLRRLIRRSGVRPDARFTPFVQDQLGDLLLADAGLAKVQRGEISHDAFMLNLAKIWAGFPTASGRSYYHGFAGNKATMRYEDYAQQVRSILGG